MPRFIINPFTNELDAVEENVGPLGDVEFLTGDSGGAVGPDGGSNITILGNPDIDVVGTPLSNTLQLTNLTKWSVYVADSVAGAAPYATIQSAINAADAAGGGLVLIRPGTYAESLTLKDGVHLRGISSNADDALVMITGTHTVPDSGKVLFTRINFTGTNAIFSHAGTSTAIIGGDMSNFYLTGGGYVFDLNVFNSPGLLVLEDCHDESTASDSGGISVTSGTGTVLVSDSSLGFGSSNALTVGCNLKFSRVDVFCPSDFSGGSSNFIQHCDFRANVTFSGSSAGSFTNSRIYSSTAQALTLSSSGDWDVANNVIRSSNVNVIGGAGVGSTYFGSNTLLGTTAVATTANLVYTDVTTECGDVFAQTLSFDRDATSHMSISATTQTVDASTVTVYSRDLGTDPGTFFITAMLVGFDPNNDDSVGYRVDGCVKTDGVTASVVEIPDYLINEDAALVDADLDLGVSGNSVVLSATGVVNKTINWKASFEIIGVTN